MKDNSTNFIENKKIIQERRGKLKFIEGLLCVLRALQTFIFTMVYR
jgi:hypothetical protein